MQETLFKTLAKLGKIRPEHVRIGIALYFIAMCIGLVPGAGIEGITGAFLTVESAATLSGMCVTLLAILLLTGINAFSVASVLSGLVLLSGVLFLVGPGYPDGLGALFRDGVLIVALMLATRPGPVRTEIFKKPSRVRGVVGKIVPKQAANPAVTADGLVAAYKARTRQKSTKRIDTYLDEEGFEDVDNIFVVAA